MGPTAVSLPLPLSTSVLFYLLVSRAASVLVQQLRCRSTYAATAGTLLLWLCCCCRAADAAVMLLLQLWSRCSSAANAAMLPLL